MPSLVFHYKPYCLIATISFNKENFVKGVWYYNLMYPKTSKHVIADNWTANNVNFSVFLSINPAEFF